MVLTGFEIAASVLPTQFGRHLLRSSDVPVNSSLKSRIGGELGITNVDAPPAPVNVSFFRPVLAEHGAMPRASFTMLAAAVPCAYEPEIKTRRPRTLRDPRRRPFAPPVHST